MKMIQACMCHHFHSLLPFWKENHCSMDDTFMNSLILHQYKLFHIYEIILSRDHDDLIKIRLIIWSIFL